jgi:hypothetical protein
MNKSFVFALSLLLLLCGWNVRAEQFVEDDAYVVHYSAFNSTMLQPEVAKAYDLMRSRQRAVMNIAVQRKMPDGSRKAVMAQLKGYTGALGGSERPLDFKVVTEGDAIYYLAEFLIGNGEKLNFDITVQPTPQTNPIKIKFSQQFFQD